VFDYVRYEFKFIYNSKKTSIVTFNVELRNKSITLRFMLASSFASVLVKIFKLNTSSFSGCIV